jgi:ferredoxin--NADP+ reductase
MMEQWIEGKVVEKRRWSDRLYSLRFKAEVEPFSAGQFTRLALEIDGERVARPYSFVNPPDEQLLEVYFNEVIDGPLSPRLAALQPGDNIWVSSKANGLFTLDQIPDNKDLWMVATGTALGVYLSILRTQESWQRFNHLLLVHNVPTRDHLSYAEEISVLQEIHGDRFKYLPITSRENHPETLSGRVLARLEDGRLEQQAGLTLSAEDSHVMLCGNINMIKEISAALEARGMQKHRKKEPGQITTEKYH